MTWVVASAQGLMTPLCQILSGKFMRGLLWTGLFCQLHNAFVGAGLARDAPGNVIGEHRGQGPLLQDVYRLIQKQL